ncbi:MAG: hypothetical protein ACE5HD_06405 [Acidobacteriota bacterium]
MTPPDDRLARGYRAATREASGTGCPSPGAIVDAVLGRLPRDERMRLADHAAGCADCSAEWRVALALRPWADEASAELEGARPVGLAAVRRRLWPGLALAASVLLMAGLAFFLRPGWRSGSPAGPVQRGGATAMAAFQPAPDSMLAAPPERFAWHAEAGARYHVALYDRESVPIWESPTVETGSVSVPEPVRRLLLPGGVYYWRLFVEQGIQRGSSPLQRFTIAADPAP